VSSVPESTMLDGMSATGTLYRLGKVTSLAALLTSPFWAGWRMLSRLLASMFERSTGGVNGIPGGKWPLIPTGATKPGPRKVELGSVMLGFDSTVRWVMVDWLRSWIVREVSGAWSLAKKAPVLASARAPSTAKTRVLALSR
jgi:hypothetical protein